jgi:DNA polymerase-3 subunit epsilon
MADAEVAAALLLHMQHDLQTRHGCATTDHALLMGLQRTSRHMVDGYLKHRAEAALRPSMRRM